MERYIGIDVHRDSSTICVLSATGKRVSREVVETNGEVLVGYLRKLRGKAARIKERMRDSSS